MSAHDATRYPSFSGGCQAACSSSRSIRSDTVSRCRHAKNPANWGLRGAARQSG
ncbi:hypothetical protein DB32_005215 [Sandaracinus amylolyticus]|uniref:Uncharacterized protein n=1 Tax=Sandaracinus amylolyticus TaxID=927083 RepID=A0A0F6YL92_9BACT|nr:hypothetical protein DB32_005215 [Sandaracinus amylolyticus]